MSKTALYRHYDADGSLLYVGISLSPITRTSQHESDAAWFDAIATITIEWLDSREDASAAEREAIRNERPRHNKQHTTDKPAQAFIDEVGKQRLADRLGVSLSSVHNARTKGVMPARWGLVVATFGWDEGISCPMCAFKWKAYPADDMTPIHEHMSAHTARAS